MTHETQDLFEVTETLPKAVQDVLNAYDHDAHTYDTCRQLETELRPLGYTFDWGLEGIPHSLRLID